MREIRGDAQSIRSLLSGSKFSIDYYQREYRWQTKQVTELINDLSDKFLESHDPSNDRSAVDAYNHYFLGSIIISDKDGQKYIIDGQQRLTTLTLMLIHLYQQLDDESQKGQLADLIFSQKYGRRSFNLNVPERDAVMDALFTGGLFDESDQPESVINILLRYQDIQDHFPQDLQGEALPYFADWLIENVHLVEITAYSDADAYTIFETMNDRGLSLTPTDMLKGYLLANIVDSSQRNQSSIVWRKHVSALQEIGKEEESDAIKGWLRSQHANSIRERKRGAKPKDFDLIGTEFHRWVRDNEEALGLQNSTGFIQFIGEDFAFYAQLYKMIRTASQELTSELEEIYYNAQSNFTLQYPVLMAPVNKTDSDAEVKMKLKLVSKYLDILITRRLWNFRSISYSALQYSMFLVMKKIRGVSIPQLASILKMFLDEEKEVFRSNERFQLHGMNGKHIHRILARFTDFVEVKSKQPSRYTEYIKRGVHGYEIEHIWADHSERHLDEFGHPADFAEYRNRIGGLLLLPKRFNASYGDLEYIKKREHYFGQNLLAQSLHEKAYEHNPGFVRFVSETGLPFSAHEVFKKDDLDARQELYMQLAEKIWNPEDLLVEAGL